MYCKGSHHPNNYTVIRDKKRHLIVKDSNYVFYYLNSNLQDKGTSPHLVGQQRQSENRGTITVTAPTGEDISIEVIIVP